MEWAQSNVSMERLFLAEGAGHDEGEHRKPDLKEDGGGRIVELFVICSFYGHGSDVFHVVVPPCWTYQP